MKTVLNFLQFIVVVFAMLFLIFTAGILSVGILAAFVLWNASILEAVITTALIYRITVVVCLIFTISLAFSEEGRHHWNKTEKES